MVEWSLWTSTGGVCSACELEWCMGGRKYGHCITAGGDKGPSMSGICTTVVVSGFDGSNTLIQDLNVEHPYEVDTTSLPDCNQGFQWTWPEASSSVCSTTSEPANSPAADGVGTVWARIVTDVLIPSVWASLGLALVLIDEAMLASCSNPLENAEPCPLAARLRHACNGEIKPSNRESTDRKPQAPDAEQSHRRSRLKHLARSLTVHNRRRGRGEHRGQGRRGARHAAASRRARGHSSMGHTRPESRAPPTRTRHNEEGANLID